MLGIVVALLYAETSTAAKKSKLPALAADKERVQQIHFNSFVFDLHVDTSLIIEAYGYDFGKKHWAPFGYMPWMGHVDLPRAKEGGLDGMFMGLVANPLWGDGPTQIRETLEVMRERVLMRFPDKIGLAATINDIDPIHNQGRMPIQFLVEGAHALGENTDNALDILDEFYQKGVRVLGLSHFTDNPYTASSASSSPDEPRLTAAGRRVIKRMNQIGMLVDLAHVHPISFRDVVKTSRAPVIVSHTGVAAVHDSFRNLVDWQIKAVAASGGVIGVMFAPHWLSHNMYPSIDVIVKHMLHIRDLVGVDFLAMGSDFDGFIWLPRKMWDVRDLPLLTQAMARAGFSELEIRKVLGLNILRVIRKVESQKTVALAPWPAWYSSGSTASE